jgi:hypothetical protein
MQSTASEWCKAQFGSSHLGDARRERRLVEIATHITEQPDQSIPRQMKSQERTKAFYRLMDNEALTHEKIQRAHWEHSRQKGSVPPLLLLIQDTTFVDLTGRDVAQVGVIGDGKGQGLLLHTTLGVIPDSQEPVGVMHQRVYRRQPTHTSTESSAKRTKRETEARFWEEAVKGVGEVSRQTRWVYVADRGGDVFGFYGTCRQYNADMLVRVAQDRRIEDAQGQLEHLITYLRQLASVGQMEVKVTDKNKHPRQASVQIAFAPVTLLPPVHARQDAPLAQTAYGIRVWEPQTPPEITPLEWLLVTSLPINDIAQAMQAVKWYAQRPLIEDYHQCLKTGFKLEQRQLHTADRFERLIGVIGVTALYLLQLRSAARLTPPTLAHTVLDADATTVIALHLGVAPSQLSTEQAWRWIAQQGGHLNRKNDPPPGWKCLWHGWSFLQSLVNGFRLARNNLPQ